MLIEFFLERARIEPTEDRTGYRGYVPELPTILVKAETAEQCRAKLAGAIAALLAIEARRDAAGGAIALEEQAIIRETTAAGNGAQRKPAAEATAGSAVEFSDIVYEKRNWVARVTFNRPSVYNTYTDHTLHEMAAAFRDAAADDGVAVVVLTGAGEKAFSAGGDMRQHVEEHIDNPQAAREWVSALIEAHSALRHLGKPSIARINGMVAGGGNDWNLACDLAIAADHARFVQVETKMGLLSAAGASRWLGLIIGDRRAREMFLTGEPISANKALLWGLVNDVVPYRQLDNATDALCHKLTDRFSVSTRRTREQLSFWKDLAWNAVVRESSDLLPTHLSGEEAYTGLRGLAEAEEIDYRKLRNAERQETGNQPKAAEKPAEHIRQPSSSSRSCYSCGAEHLPGNYQYCGICGTRLL